MKTYVFLSFIVAYIVLLIGFVNASNNSDKDFRKVPRLWEGLGLEDYPAKGTPLDRFNFDFLTDSYQSWPFAHIVNPFTFFMLFQSTSWTVVLILFWETVEVTTLTLGTGGYMMFIGDKDTPESEPSTDSMIGDVLEGFIGILLGKLIVMTYKIPSWTPSRKGPYRHIFYKRAIQYICYQPAFSICNAKLELEGYPPFPYGTLVTCMWLFGVTLLFKRLNFTIEEYALFWAGKDKYASRDYDTIYTVYVGTAVLLMANPVYLITQGYFQAWATVSLMVGFHLTVLAWQGRSKEIWTGLLSRGVYTYDNTQHAVLIYEDQLRYYPHAYEVKEVLEEAASVRVSKIGYQIPNVDRPLQCHRRKITTNT